MKNLMMMLLSFGLSFASAQQVQVKNPVKKEMKSAPTKKEVEKKEVKEPRLKKDGTLDRRFKENKGLKKDGTPDMRFKQNKK